MVKKARRFCSLLQQMYPKMKMAWRKPSFKPMSLPDFNAYLFTIDRTFDCKKISKVDNAVRGALGLKR